MSDLKPCPFCGSDNTRAYSSTGICWVECLSCDAVGPTAKTEAEAIDAWNMSIERVCVWTRRSHRDRFGYDHDTQCSESCAKKTGGNFCQFCGGRLEVKDE